MTDRKVEIDDRLKDQGFAWFVSGVLMRTDPENPEDCKLAIEVIEEELTPDEH